MPTPRAITGTLRRQGDDAPLVGASVTFEAYQLVVDEHATHPPTSVTVTSAALGALSFSLTPGWWRVTLPGARPATFRVPEGVGALTLEALLLGSGAYVPPSAADTFQDMIDAAIAAVEGATLSDAIPQPLGAAAAGDDEAAARGDHRHAMPSAADVGALTEAAADLLYATLGDLAALVARVEALEAPAITIASPVPYQIIQRDPVTNLADIPISGTVTGAGVHDVEARFNGGAWATIATGETGAFSGTLTGQAVGMGTLEVRLADLPATGDSVASVGVGDIFVIAGQSNAMGFADNNQPAPVNAGLYGNDDQWKQLADPVDSNVNQVDTVSNDAYNKGSYWPRLAQEIADVDAVPVAFVPCATPQPIANWLPGADHFDRDTLYGNITVRALAAGGGTVGAAGVRAVLWHQGEGDSVIASFEGGATYKARLEALADALAIDIGVPLIAARIHLWDHAPATDAAHVEEINEAITDAATDNVNILLGPDFYNPNWTTGDIHGLSDAEMIDAGERWYAALVAAGVYAGATDELPVAGVAAWYSFRDPATLFTDTARTAPVAVNDDLVRGVEDKGPNGLHLQATADRAPLYKTAAQNGLSALLFSADVLTRTSVTLSSLVAANAGTIYIVQRRTSPNGVTIKLAAPDTSNQFGALTPTVGNLYLDWGDAAGAGRRNVSDPGVLDAWAVIELYRSGNAAEFYVNGVSAGTSTFADDLDTSQSGTLLLGADDTSGTFSHDGHIGELAIFNRALTAGERAAMRTHLMDKWGLS